MSIESITAIIIAIFASQGFWSFVQSRYEKKYNNQTSEQKLLLGLTYQTICETCRAYIEEGSIDSEDYKFFVKYLYDPYKSLGGNGIVDKLMNEVEKLPIK